uniref:Probable zinc-ribbon domain-containing protein n=1 Tax=Leersia perrieri TaxID=77586 RepID=A0A0D9V768_9ORYZ
MESEQVKRRFGRCPYCRAMIYQDPKAVIYYCSKCRTPIRGKSPEPTDEAEFALSQLEILSADTASVFSDEPETLSRSSSVAHGGGGGGDAPYRSRSQEMGLFNSVRTGPRSGGAGEQSGDERGGGSPMHGRAGDLRPTSRRTRRPISGDMGDVSSYGSDNDMPSSAASFHRRYRASPLSSQELDAPSSTTSSSMGMSSGYQPSGVSSSSIGSSSVYQPSSVGRSPLNDPAFQKDLLLALDNLRRVIAAVEQPYVGVIETDHTPLAGMPQKSASCNDAAAAGEYKAVTRRNSRLMRRLESQLVQALPREDGGVLLRRDASTSSSASSSSSGRRRKKKHHCRAVMGGTPFVVCGKCTEILQLPAAVAVQRTARLQCGACGEALSIRLPAAAAATASGATERPKKIFSAPQPAVRGREEYDEEEGEEEEYAVARSNLSGEQRWPAEGPLHRMLGYSTVSSVFRSRRHDN